MAEIGSKNCEADEEVGGCCSISNLVGNNNELQVGRVSSTNSDLKRKLLPIEDENNLELKEKEVNEYADNSKRNKSDDSEHNEKINTEKCETVVEEQQEEASAEVNGIVPESRNDSVDYNCTGPIELKAVVTVKEEVIDDSFNCVIKKEPCDGNYVVLNEEIPAAASIKDEASNNAVVPPDMQSEITLQFDGSAASINDEANNNAAAAILADVQPEIKVEPVANSRPSCRFGVKCYRANALHRQEEAHPGDQDYRRPDYPQPPADTPMCPFMHACYRRNPVHFQQFSHPDGYNNHVPVPRPPPLRIHFIDDMEENEVDFEGFSDADSDYDPNETSDEGVGSGMEE